MTTPLIQLKGIGKIYVSEGNVAVGIRGVDLTFEKGEFVAVTGKSGSGKSTLLNVISGMDSYEEGEMLVEGEPTSHYLQKDWEEYRKQYISFIFQEYNIIESFTVLQNVELALMNIENPAERREKAVDLLTRVGMEKFMHHKGSKLSGGQKQRTVIARALAKDSPVILADEPTGNLDSKTSEEIINLLREVSKDKLVIVVTHNFEQVEHCATRHIRIFDGAVESDQTLTQPEPVRETMPETEGKDKKNNASDVVKHTVRNGIILGRVRFGATPKLTVFLCLLMTLTALVMTLVTSFTAESKELFEKNYMFKHMDGRAVVTRSDGTAMTSEQLEELKAKTGADRSVRFDYLLDTNAYVMLYRSQTEVYDVMFTFDSPAEKVTLDGGRYPEKPNEIVLSLPISYKPALGTGDAFKPFALNGLHGENMVLPPSADSCFYTVTGVSYYYDNTKDARILLTEEGYKTVSVLYYFYRNANYFGWSGEMNVRTKDGFETPASTGNSYIFVDYDLPAGTYCLYNLDNYLKDNKLLSGPDVTMTGKFVSSQRGYYGIREYGYTDYYVDYDYAYGYGETVEITGTLDKYKRLDALPNPDGQPARVIMDTVGFGSEVVLVLSPDVLADFMYNEYFDKSYTQASLFFGSDREARNKVEELREAGYIAVPTDETAEEDELDRLVKVLALGGMLIGWILMVVFIALFMSLCTSRAMNATKGDVGIMRSMGIPARVVKTSVYVQTLLSLIPAFIVTAIVCTVIFLVPQLNGRFNFLHAGEYILVAVVMIGIALVLSKRYCSKMFSESVKKTLKGGNKT